MTGVDFEESPQCLARVGSTEPIGSERHPAAGNEPTDLVGDRLTGAAIIGVGLPGICAERDIMREYYNRKNGFGFEFSYMFPGFIRVLQALGRVIRSETDKGAVLLIDERFTASRYRRLYPSNWNPLQVSNDERLADALGAFWDGEKRDRDMPFFLTG